MLNFVGSIWDLGVSGQKSAPYYSRNLREKWLFWNLCKNTLVYQTKKSKLIKTHWIVSQKCRMSSRYYWRNLREKLLFWNFVCKNTLDYLKKSQINARYCRGNLRGNHFLGVWGQKSAQYYRRNFREKWLFWNFLCKKPKKSKKCPIL